MLAQPILLFAGLALAALGVLLALPKPGVSPRGLGNLIGLIAACVVFVAMGLRANGGQPNVFYYVFAVLALYGAVKLISHPKPVYAALFFILTILAGSGLFLILSSEFMAFALVIIYAGAILITYLFVLMLATQAPSAEEIEALAQYDRFARAPVAAVAGGFLLLAVLVALIGQGIAEMGPGRASVDQVAYAERMPRKLEREMRRAGLPQDIRVVGMDGDAVIVAPRDPQAFRDTLAAWQNASGEGGEVTPPRLAALYIGPAGDGAFAFALPDTFEAHDIERVGLALVGEHPLGLELAGIILLMAMLGAVILARKQIEVEEQRKALAAQGGAGGGA